jgi:hypothetical protein
LWPIASGSSPADDLRPSRAERDTERDCRALPDYGIRDDQAAAAGPAQALHAWRAQRIHAVPDLVRGLPRKHGVAALHGVGAVRIIYFGILITHVVLAALILPMALLTTTRGLREQYVKHVRIARWTLPVWLYVSVTGVIIYVMLYQLY